MRYERTTIATGHAITDALVSEHIRVDGALITGAMHYADTAAREVEDYAGLALLEQTITATTDAWPGECIELPIGPVLPDATATVEIIEQDGTTTTVADGYWLEAGRYPRLHFATTPGGRLRITYAAGYGEDAAAFPTDLAHAIADHAARLYDMRGTEDAKPGLSPAAARICARYRRVRL